MPDVNYFSSLKVACFMCAAFAVIQSGCNTMKNTEPPEFLIQYHEPAKTIGDIFTYEKKYSISNDKLIEISNREYDKWFHDTSTASYDFCYGKTFFGFIVNATADDPKDWQITGSAYPDRKDREDNYIPTEEHYQKIVPMLRQMQISRVEELEVKVWEFSDGYFQIVTTDKSSWDRSEAYFHNELCLKNGFSEKTQYCNLIIYELDKK